MADRPIIFSATMVRALLEGRKTQTRRVLKPQPMASGYYDGALRLEQVYSPDSQDPDCYARFSADAVGGGAVTEEMIKLPYAPGDRLWMREAFNAFQFSQDGDETWPVKIPTLEECKEAEELAYRYGAPQIIYRESDRARKWFADQKWRPSIHMPRWASRLTLLVTDVRVQRLQEISGEDCIAEGADCDTCAASWSVGRSACNQRGCFEIRRNFHDLWNSLHGPEAWDANPWVCAVSFTVHRCNIDQMREP